MIKVKTTVNKEKVKTVKSKVKLFLKKIYPFAITFAAGAGIGGVAVLLFF